MNKHSDCVLCGRETYYPPYCHLCADKMRRAQGIEGNGMTTDIKIFNDGPPEPYIIRPCHGKPRTEQNALLSDPPIMEYRITCPCSRRTGWHRTMEAAVLEWSTFDLMGDSADEAIE